MGLILNWILVICFFIFLPFFRYSKSIRRFMKKHKIIESLYGTSFLVILFLLIQNYTDIYRSVIIVTIIAIIIFPLLVVKKNTDK